MRSAQHDVGEDGLAVLRQRITDLAVRLGKGSDRQTS
jgi:hypothetical protein